jgi:hypothetical protein
VLVAFDVPCMTDGLCVSSYVGTGLVVDAAQVHTCCTLAAQ